MSGEKKFLSNVSRLGAVLLLVEDGGIEALLKSLLDVGIMRRKFRDVKAAGSEYVERVMAAPLYDRDEHGADAEAVAGWALGRFRDSFALTEREDI